MQKTTHTLHHAPYQMHYYTVGTGPLLVCLHGWPTNARLWDAQVAAFQNRYRVLTLDWLGFGQSDHPTDYAYTFTQQAQWLGRILEQELPEGEQVTLLAHDIGGPAAILWASAHPTQVRQLVLLNTVLYPFSTTTEKISQVLFHTPLLNRLLMSRFGLGRIMKDNTRTRESDFVQRLNTILDHHTHQDHRLWVRTITEPVHGGKTSELPTIAQTLADLPVPKQLIIAEEDPLCYAYMKRFTEEHPDVPAQVLEKCGHYMPLDRPEGLNAILEAVLLAQKTP